MRNGALGMDRSRRPRLARTAAGIALEGAGPCEERDGMVPGSLRTPATRIEEATWHMKA